MKLVLIKNALSSSNVIGGARNIYIKKTDINKKHYTRHHAPGNIEPDAGLNKFFTLITDQ